MAVTVTQDGLSITVSGDTGLSVCHLCNNIADSKIWQAIVANPRAKWEDIVEAAGGDDLDRSAALDAIAFDRVDDLGQGEAAGEEVARCIIRPLDEWTTQWVAVGSWDVTGLMLVTFELPEPDCYQGPSRIKLAFLDFMEKIDAIKSDAMNPQILPDRLMTPDFRQVIVPGLIDPAMTLGRLRTVTFSVTKRGANG